MPEARNVSTALAGFTEIIRISGLDTTAEPPV
jgi:hypothetical protein